MVFTGNKIGYVVFFFLYLFFERPFALCQSKKINKEIAIVNIGNHSRDSIATMIEIVNSLGPKVISLDVALPVYSGSSTDRNLRRVLVNCKNLVMPSRIRNIGKDYYGREIILVGLTCAMPFFPSKAKTGFVSAMHQPNDLFIPRQFMVWEKSYTDDIYYHFSVVTAMQFDSVRASDFIRRHERMVDVNYTDERFVIFSSSNVLNHKLTKEDVGGKIVLFGFLGPGDEDLFLAHSNGKPTGVPMYGVEYLATIVAQVLKGQ